MPKAKTQVEVNGTRKTIARRIKFKLGGRKSLKSALSLSTAELLEIVADKSAGRKRHKAGQVLTQRGVSLETATTPDENTVA